MLSLESQSPALAAQFLVKRDQKEFDNFKKLGFGMNSMQFVDFKDREADNQEQAWKWLAGITGNAAAKKYALDHAQQAHEAAGPDPNVADFGKYVARFGAAVDALNQGVRDTNAHSH